MTTKLINRVKKTALMIEIILLLMIAFIYYLAQPVQAKNLIHVPKGSIVKIIAYLKNEGTPLVAMDRYLIRFFGLPQHGWIDLESTQLTKGDLFYKLCHSKAATKAIILYPGETTFVFLQTLAEVWNFDFEKLYAYYKEKTPFIEGYLIPQTYSIPIEMDEIYVIDVLLGYAKRFHSTLSFELLGRYDPKEWKRYLKIASIVQKEAANTTEMPIVASVIYNRLEKGMRLQMDGTLNYGKYSHQKVTPYRIRHDRSPYNTYLYKGIPPEPVCVVEKESIRAAIKPSETDYLYFMKNKKGLHDFSRYYSTHLKNIGNVKK